jgi:hypothetical protein
MLKGIISSPVASYLGQSNCTVAYSTGAPLTSHINGVSTGPVGTPIAGSLYIRSDGTAGNRIYWFYGGSWVPQSTP